MSQDIREFESHTLRHVVMASHRSAIVLQKARVARAPGRQSRSQLPSQSFERVLAGNVDYSAFLQVIQIATYLV
ncbi:MAG: hypothetical protein ABIR26_11015, partial [Ramlibacter sp.]